MRKRLNVWLIKEGEALPVDSNARLMRTGLLAQYLSEQGHEVTWWSSGFIHGKKEYYCKEYQEIKINSRETLVLLHSPISYKRNVSPQRILYHQMLARQMKQKFKEKEKPDIIICSYPTIQFANVAVKYGQKNHVPVVIDVRDLWPDIFERVFPKRLKWLAHIGMIPLKMQVRNVFKRATAISGVVPHCVKWGINYIGREIRETDRFIYIGYQKEKISDEAFDSNIRFWQEQGITSNNWIICFFGTLSSNSLDLLTVIQAIKNISEKYPEIRLVICGAGDAREQFMQEAQGSNNIVLPGWMGKEQMQSLMKISKCGLYCYKNTMDFTNAFGNKIIQYMSEGLPVLSSLQGFSKTYMMQNNMGLTYEEGNVEDCIHQLQKMYENETLRMTMAKQSLECFERDFDAKIVNQKFEDYIYDIL